MIGCEESNYSIPRHLSAQLNGKSFRKTVCTSLNSLNVIPFPGRGVYQEILIRFSERPSSETRIEDQFGDDNVIGDVVYEHTFMGVEHHIYYAHCP